MGGTLNKIAIVAGLVSFLVLLAIKSLFYSCADVYHFSGTFEGRVANKPTFALNTMSLQLKRKNLVDHSNGTLQITSFNGGVLKEGSTYVGEVIVDRHKNGTNYYLAELRDVSGSSVVPKSQFLVSELIMTTVNILFYVSFGFLFLVLYRYRDSF
ncbi:hypothetical protein AKJ18_22175 [Vibrio xuii]|nr:hypothetical protein AKJ18_22175 [Vibrio xuii]